MRIAAAAWTVLATTAAVTTATTTAATARPDDDPMELGVFVGAHLFSHTNELGANDGDPSSTSPENAVTFGLRLGYRVLPGFRLEGELALMPTSSRGGDADLFVVGWRGHAVFQVLDGSIAPFVLLGVGGSSLSSEKNAVLHEDTDFVPEGGIGARIKVAGNWGVRLDGRILLPPSTSGSGVTVDWEILGGIYATFSAPAKKPAPAGVPAPPPAAVAPAPMKDSDGDGIPDQDDKCPDEAEDRDGFQDADGCPDPDNDGDGILDKDDRCPNEPETKNGFQDDDGCPDEVPSAVKRFTGRIAGVTFALGSVTIDESSDWVLDAAARVLKNNPTVKLEIAGHTDDTGTQDKNTKLSQARADAVKAYLVAKGVEAERLTAVGYGPDRPVDSGKTPQARARNRRVEFKILTQ